MLERTVSTVLLENSLIKYEILSLDLLNEIFENFKLKRILKNNNLIQMIFCLFSSSILLKDASQYTMIHVIIYHGLRMFYQHIQVIRFLCNISSLYYPSILERRFDEYDHLKRLLKTNSVNFNFSVE